MADAPVDSGSKDSVIFLTRGNLHAPPTAHRMEHREALFVRSFINCGTLKPSAKEAGIGLDLAREVLSRPEVAEYIEEKLMEQASAAGVTREAVMASVGALLANPTMEASSGHLKALDIAAKILKMIQPNLHLHQGVPADSPFKEMSNEQFYAEFQKRMTYREPLSADQAPAIPAMEPKYDA